MAAITAVSLELLLRKVSCFVSQKDDCWDVGLQSQGGDLV